MTHIPKLCSVSKCGYDASYWVSTWTGATFFMCDAHMEQVAGYDEEGSVRAEIYMPNVLTGNVGATEIGVYSCSEECDECNS